MTVKFIRFGKLSSTLRITPKGWVRKKGRKNEWYLKTGKHLSQPIIVDVKEYDQTVDYSQKTGCVAHLGEFAGRGCDVDVLRKNKKEAVKDCFVFMRKNEGLDHVKLLLSQLCFEQEKNNY